MKRFLQAWAINSLAVLVADFVLPGIHSDKWQDLLLASLLLGILNAVVRPIMMLVALPLLILTLGFFMIVINAALLLLVGEIVHGFVVAGFGSAVLGAIIISVVSLVLNLLTGTGRSRIHLRRFDRPPPPSNRPDDGNGPVIDV